MRTPRSKLLLGELMSNPDSVGTNWRPKCARCRHHGIVTMKKGHTKVCPFLECQCSKCCLITERTKITALQRELRKAKKEQRPGAGDGDATFMGPPSGGAPERGTPADPWRKPEPGGEPVPGPDMRNVPPSVSGKRPSPDSAGFDEVMQMTPLPFIPFPFKMPSYYHHSFPAPSPHLLPNVPWLPPVPVGFGPLMFPQPQQCAVNYPPPQVLGPPPNSRQVFFIHQPQRDSENSAEQQNPPPAAAIELDPAEVAAELDAAEQVSGGSNF